MQNAFPPIDEGGFELDLEPAPKQRPAVERVHGGVLRQKKGVQRQRRRSCLVREENAQKKEARGRNSKGNVYLWPEAEPERYLRKRIDRSQARTIWDDYTVEMKRYDVFPGQWDICRAFRCECSP